VPETITVCRNILTGSVTAAWSGNVTIGRCTPAIAATSEPHPAVQFTTTGVATGPRLVVTLVTRPSLTSMPSTSVRW
jgi:hypothetical protein